SSARATRQTCVQRRAALAGFITQNSCGGYIAANHGVNDQTTMPAAASAPSSHRGSSRTLLRRRGADRRAEIHVSGPGQERKHGIAMLVEEAVPGRAERFRERGNAEHGRREQQRGPAQRSWVRGKREQHGQREEQRKTDAREDVHPRDPARLAEDG